MIGISKLYCSQGSSGDAIRYGHNSALSDITTDKTYVPKSARERRPVVVFNITRTCNLKCVHCYSDSENKKYTGELTTNEIKNILKDLSRFSIPALLLSGGEPLMHPDFSEIAEYGRSLGLRITLSTNGTLITDNIAKELKKLGISYVGVSLDGIGEINDKFRGRTGAFKEAIKGFQNCVTNNQRVGLRLTLTKQNVQDLNKIFDFIEAKNINRACFYHLAYSGRGSKISEYDLTHEETRNAMDIILERTQDFYTRGLNKDILTVDNHVDGIYLYLKQLKEHPEQAAKTLELLKWNGGGTYSSGVGIGNIDFLGNVHPDQFWMHYSFGNVKERPFSEIWQDTSNPLMAGLKNRIPLLKGKCKTCKWLDACGGALRVRADVFYNDPWAPDPACYLTEKEII